jgi:DNA-binding NarL/FixJ family response regulator
VDDNPVVRKTLRQLLEDGGSWEISEAEDGKVAISRALEFRPDVIVLDLVMPVMDGLNAAREISRVLPDAAIVMYTMHWSAALEIEAQKSGVRKLVSKSQSNVLLATVQELIAALPAEAAPKNTEPVSAIALSNDPTLAATPNPGGASSVPDISKPPSGKLAS